MIQIAATPEIISPANGEAIHVDMPAQRYHATGNWSHSQLKWLPDDPETFEWRYILKREEFKASRAMVCGAALHAWLLEDIEPTVVPVEYLTRAGNMRPGGWDDLAQEFPGMPVVKDDERTGIRYARENCMADPEIRAYLETAGHVEHSLFAIDAETGLPTKVRLDKLCRFRDGLACLDAKYSGGIDDRWIEQQVTAMGYYRQAGLYWEHAERAYETPNQWVFLFILNKPPYTARIKQLLPCDIELGARHEHIALRDLRARLDSGNWRGPGFGHIGLTGVAKWLWDRGIGEGLGEPAPVETLEEFAQFSGEE